jgi:hypothetical protein
MKVSWTAEHIERTRPSVAAWRNAKRREFEELTGLRWVNYSAHGKIIFHPTWSRETPETNNEELVERLRNFAPNYTKSATFLKAAAELDVSLTDVLSTTKWMARHGLVFPVVGRTGDAMGFYSTGQKEASK